MFIIAFLALDKEEVGIDVDVDVEVGADDIEGDDNVDVADGKPVANTDRKVNKVNHLTSVGVID